ncbi:MAG: MNIO family bufferin maturase, partial [Rhodospirillaceae bacterium]
TAGIGLRHPHDEDFAREAPDAPLTASWIEVHSENFLCDGGRRLALLDDVRRRYPISCHGVGLSLGSADGLDAGHLKRLAKLFDRVRPALISEHLSWSVTGGVYLNDLLPLPYNDECLSVLARNISHAQDVLGRRILVENPSRYLGFGATQMPESAFLAALVRATGCGLLLDVNNIYVSTVNTGGSAEDYIREIPAEAVGEIHLAGHSIEGEGEDRVLIDTHSTRVCDDVWDLYRKAITRLGPRPTLIEWDRDLPKIEVLVEEARIADRVMAEAASRRGAA